MESGRAQTRTAQAALCRRATLGLGSLLLGACGGGGSEIAAPPTTIAFSTAGGTVAEGAAPLSMTVVLHTTLAALTEAATIDVVDTGMGSAASGSDYAAFAPVTITFPIGAVDGDIQTVPFAATGDLVVEGTSETVRFGLQNTVSGVAAGVVTFTATVTDVDVATIQFDVASSLTADESLVARDVFVELDLPASTSLGVAVTATVSDAGGGSATSGVDYGAVPAQTVTFPAGSLDGATQTMSVLILDDASIEADETVHLSLSAPSAGSTLGATSLHVLSIQDDDATGTPAFVATEGATGVENALAYDALVLLGSQTVGAGPNAGTLVRVANAGGSLMDLGAPALSGINPNDFDVVIDSAPLQVPPAPGEAGFVLAPEALAPFTALETKSGTELTFALDAARLAALQLMPRATLHAIPVPGMDDVTLDLRQLRLPFAPDAVLRVDGVDVPGGIAAVVGDLSVWSGSVLEMPGSRVFLSFSSEGARGFIELPLSADRYVHVETRSGPGSNGAPATGSIVRTPDLAAFASGTPEFCAGERFVPGATQQLELDASAFVPPSDSLTASDCLVAIETDYQLFQRFPSTLAASTYVTQLMAAISDQYFTDVQTTISIAYLGLYSSVSDPWLSQDSGGDAGDLLDEFRNDWVANGWPVSANLAHFISGAGLGGGVAYVGVLCNQGFGFGVSGNINGSINWGTWTGAAANFTWDFVVVAHEMGHNFGSSHTHSYCPPLDLCYTNCNGTTACSQGTIMSYCHTCGGMDNIDLEFHPVTANIMRASVNSSCLGLSALGVGDYVQYRVRFNPLTATGQRDANLTFSHDAPNVTQPFRIRLRGTAN